MQISELGCETVGKGSRKPPSARLKLVAGEGHYSLSIDRAREILAHIG
jgi:hypothetical protein